MSSLQFYHAWKKGLLIPWKPELAEHYKTFRQLLIADRGGLIYEPVIGVHEKVAEFDFASLYPSIMLKKNLSVYAAGSNARYPVGTRIRVVSVRLWETATSWAEYFEG